MFRRKRKAQEIEKFERVYSKGSFEWAITHTKRMVEWSKTLEDKLAVIDYVMNVIKRDIETDALSRYLYKPPFPYKNENYFLLPMHFYNKEGEEINLLDDGEVATVKLSDSSIVSYISKLNSIWCSIVNFKEKFTFGKNSHFARYYKEIDVCYVWNGLHSVGMRVYRGVGELKANQVSLEKAYEHMDTDGENWINVHTGETLMKVHDFRIAILYELAKMKHRLRNNGLL